MTSWVSDTIVNEKEQLGANFSHLGGGQLWSGRGSVLSLGVHSIITGGRGPGHTLRHNIDRRLSE